MKTSIQAIAKSLSEEDRKQFQEVFTGMYMLAGMASGGDMERTRKIFDGFSFKDIMEKAQQMREEMRKAGVKE